MENDKSIHLILSIGLDGNTLISRNHVLRLLSYPVLESVSVDDGFQLFASTDFDLAIRCDSIRHHQEAKLARSMEGCMPLAPILAVVRGLTRMEHADIPFNNLLGPEALLKIGTLLKETPFGTTDLQKHTRCNLARLENLMNGSVLGSWQEIANYIGRRPRTVQRWERQFGMPVHRRRRDKRRAVFAFSGELDHWLRSTPSNRACGGQRQTTNAMMEPFRKHSMSGFLNSWKEVAQFVGLGVRTVQRLEQHSGFPVHRPACKLRSPIIAIPEEIEHWLDNRPFGRHESAGCTAARKSNAMPQYFT